MNTKLKPKHRIARYAIALLAITGFTLLILAGGQESILNIVIMGIIGLVCLIPAMMYSTIKEQVIQERAEQLHKKSRTVNTNIIEIENHVSA